MYKVMIIEDDKKISSILIQHLRKWNFDPVEVTDFEYIDQQFMKVKPQLVLLDINLPFYDGFHWCSKIRQVSNVPIIFISSRNQNMDIIMAMNMGGDDFVQKPFSLDVLVAKMNAILRRTYQPQQQVEKDVLEYKGILLNLENGTVSFQEKEINLTKNEFHMMYILLRNAGSIVTRDEIIHNLWEHEDFIDDNTLTVNMGRLRKKLEQICLMDRIVTKKRQGYLLQ